MLPVSVISAIPTNGPGLAKRTLLAAAQVATVVTPLSEIDFTLLEHDLLQAVAHRQAQDIAVEGMYIVSR